jgi:aryl-alcohol dehydrogenase-like predicted oxidoreductase
LRYRTLGKTGFQVSDIGHGLWGMSGWSGSEDQQSLNSLQRSVDLGCTFFDTAWAYGDGHSDELLGHILKQNPDKQLVAASKVPPLNRKWPAKPEYKLNETFPRQHVIETADRIRKALGVDRIDVLQYHVWDDSWADEAEFRETVEELKSSGRVHSFGLSLNRWQPANGVKAIRTGLVDTVQVIYNIFDQNPEDELFPLCREMNVGIIARVPLDEGSLGGKMTRDTRFPAGDWRNGYFNPQNLSETMDRVEKLQELLHDGVTLPQLAFRFILSNPDVSTTIPGMRNPKHVDENIANSDAGALPSKLLQSLRAFRWDRQPTSWSA